MQPGRYLRRIPNRKIQHHTGQRHVTGRFPAHTRRQRLNIMRLDIGQRLIITRRIHQPDKGFQQQRVMPGRINVQLLQAGRYLRRVANRKIQHHAGQRRVAGGFAPHAARQYRNIMRLDISQRLLITRCIHQPDKGFQQQRVAPRRVNVQPLQTGRYLRRVANRQIQHHTGQRHVTGRLPAHTRRQRLDIMRLDISQCLIITRRIHQPDKHAEPDFIDRFAQRLQRIGRQQRLHGVLPCGEVKIGQTQQRVAPQPGGNVRIRQC